MPFTIQNCVLSYKSYNYFSEKQLARDSQVATFCYPHFNRWQIGLSGGKFSTCYCQFLTLAIQQIISEFTMFGDARASYIFGCK